MAFTPIFDLSVSAEKTEALLYLSNYAYYSGMGTYTDAQLQVEINNASERIYSYTKYYPKTTNASLIIPINKASGYGIIPYKIPTNLTQITSTDYMFTGFVFDKNYVIMYHDGNLLLTQFCYDSTNNFKIYPNSVNITIDYGFVKATQMPLVFKSTCIDLVMHYLTAKQDQALRETSRVQDNQIVQNYNKFVEVELSILKQLRNVRIY